MAQVSLDTMRSDILASYSLTDSNNGNRPVSFMVWYPVDARTISSSTPPAQYPLDPYTGTTYLPITLSTDWEPLGYDPAYEGPNPSGDGPFPLVVFSPGFTDPSWLHIFIGTRLASHGYVVAVIDHYADCEWAWSPCDDLLTVMVNRPRDVSFVITRLLNKNGSARESGETRDLRGFSSFVRFDSRSRRRCGNVETRVLCGFPSSEGEQNRCGRRSIIPPSERHFHSETRFIGHSGENLLFGRPAERK